MSSSLQDRRLALQTVLTLDLRVKHNLFMNLPAYIYQPGIGPLKNRCQNQTPGILVAAGPSLAKNIHLLAQAKRHAVIAVVGTAYKRVLAASCVPDVVTTLDYHPASLPYLEGVGDYGDTILVASPQAYYGAVDTWKGRKLLTGSSYIEQFVSVQRPSITTGATVAHLTFHLLEHMGCNPIVLVGQDLAFSHHVTHVPGSSIHRGWYSQVNRFNTMEMLEWQEIARLRGRGGQPALLQEVQGWNGEKLYTDPQMLSYLHRFEEEFEKSQATVIDATEGGAKKKGAVAMNLEDVLRKQLNIERPPGLLRFHLWKFFEQTPKPSEVVRQLEEHLDDVADAAFLYSEVLGLLDHVEDHFRETERWEKIAAIRQEIEAKAAVGKQIAAINHKADTRYQMRNEEIALAELGGPGLLKARLERDIEYLKTLVESAAVLSAMLRHAAERVAGVDVEEIRRMWDEQCP